MTRLLLGAAVLASLSAIAGPAQAQKTQRYVEVYGDDACPMGSDNEVVVCARKPESDRYRIPERLRSPVQGPATQTWADRSESVLQAGGGGPGQAGTGTCSANGANGWTGCWTEQMRKAKAQREQDQQEPVVKP